MTTIGTATIPDPLIPSYEQLSVEVGRLRAELAAKDALLAEARKVVTKSFDRIHCLPRTSDTELADRISAFLTKLKEQE